jgi:triphosphoribosyl-dephospho-CoA synthetase
MANDIKIGKETITSVIYGRDEDTSDELRMAVFDANGYQKVNVITGAITASPPTAPATATVNAVTMTGAADTLAASNASRKGLYVFNNAAKVVYVKLGASASTTSFTVKLADQQYFELPSPVYTGAVTAFATVGGDVLVTEV